MPPRLTRTELSGLVLLALMLLGCGQDRAGAAPREKTELSKSINASEIRAAKTGDNPRITLGQSQVGALESSDPVLTDGTHFDTWIFEGSAGQAISASLRSTEFDAYLLLAQQTPDDLVILTEDDDSAGGTDARVNYVLPANGTYALLANSFYAGEVGAYTLTLEAGSGPAASLSDEEFARRYPGGGDPSDRYALLVGIDDYAGIGSSLEGPVADARLIGQILVERYGFAQENVVILSDREATRGHITQAFLRHLGQAGPDGVAVFYYSGHGMQMDSNYALTGMLDPEPDEVDEALYIWGDDGRGSVLLDDELGFLADRLRTDRVILILDACNSGTASRGAAGGQAKEVQFANVKAVTTIPSDFLVKAPESSDTAGSAAGVTELLTQPQRHVLLAASASDELAWTASGWPKYGGTISVFTYYLAEALTGSAPGASLSAIMDEVRDNTAAYTQSTYAARQTPRAEGAQVVTSLHEFLRKR